MVAQLYIPGVVVISGHEDWIDVLGPAMTVTGSVGGQTAGGVDRPTQQVHRPRRFGKPSQRPKNRLTNDILGIMRMCHPTPNQRTQTTAEPAPRVRRRIALSVLSRTRHGQSPFDPVLGAF